MNEPSTQTIMWMRVVAEPLRHLFRAPRPHESWILLFKGSEDDGHASQFAQFTPVIQT